MSSEPANACAELLLEYQGVVVHDLRGELNALLLTVDYVRRQVGARPELAQVFGDTLGDLDHVRTSVNRTLYQLELVGVARKSLAKKAAAEFAPQNLCDIVRDVMKQFLNARAHRRHVSLADLPASDLAVRADPVLLHLAVQRLLHGMIDLGRDAEMGIEIREPGLDGDATVSGTGDRSPPTATLHVRFTPPQKAVSEVMSQLDVKEVRDDKSTSLNALRLTARLAEAMGGRLQYNQRDAEVRLELPRVMETAAECNEN
ncbi:HAMP domain-containing histidine kinase [Humisphaera borealis]|uniref:HAMP domain-containing histidine kinase n=1 Tax=Humisphaera borealis TaxID=2807512 RepID=A0A7M2WRF6_9BACT|nr:HAMP domain-containing histidine kinase [Humisphaera borealis]QOV87732.1 HAMP domain-containing histidine kinase [Humisphaera borealis]